MYIILNMDALKFKNNYFYELPQELKANILLKTDQENLVKYFLGERGQKDYWKNQYSKVMNEFKKELVGFNLFYNINGMRFSRKGNTIGVLFKYGNILNRYVNIVEQTYYGVLDEINEEVVINTFCEFCNSTENLETHCTSYFGVLEIELEIDYTSLCSRCSDNLQPEFNRVVNILKEYEDDDISINYNDVGKWSFKLMHTKITDCDIEFFV